MIPTYGSSRQKLPDSSFDVAVIAGATTEGRTVNLYISAENRAGLNQLSNPKQLTLNPGEGVEITINDEAIASGEEVFWLVISGETTGDPQDAVRLASFKAKQDDQETYNDLPATISLVSDYHFTRKQTYDDFASLPSSGVLDGAIAKTSDTGNYYFYDSSAYVDIDGYKSYGTSAEGGGNWVLYRHAFSTYVPDTEAGIGSDRALSTISTALTIPKKVGDAVSTPIIYWLNNEFSEDGGSPIVSDCYNFAVAINGDDYTGVFAEKIAYTLLGYVERNTGVPDTSIDLVGEQQVWSPTSPIKINNLPRNHAAAIAVVLDYPQSEMAGKLPEVVTTLELNIIKVGGNSGRLSPIANRIGDSVDSTGNKLLIVPGITRLSGFATIRMDGAVGYEINTNSSQEIANILPDTANQIAAMSGAANGLITIRQQGDDLEGSERIRAYVGTESGLSNPLAIVSSDLTVDSEALRITVEHPINSSNLGIIRSDYPDVNLRGIELGRFTPTRGYLFLDLDGNYYQSGLIPIVANGSNPVQIIDTDLANFSAIAQLPVQANPGFSLFEPVAITVAANGTGTTTGTVKVYWSYAYELPNFIATEIRHDGDETIPTAQGTLGKVLENALQARKNLEEIDDPPTALANLGGVPQTVFDTLTAVVTGIANTIATFGNVVTRNVGTGAGNVIELEDDGGIPKLPAVDGSQLVNLKNATQDAAIADLQAKTGAATLTPKTLEASDLPYLLTLDDHGKELVVSNISGTIAIPDDLTGFDANFLVLIHNDGGADIAFDREDGQQTDLLFSDNKRNSRSIGGVTIRRRQATNTFLINGLLE